MSEAANLKVVQDGYAAFARRDIGAILNLMADDVVWYGCYGCDPHVPAAGVFQGKKGVADYFQRVADTSTITSFDVKDMVASGDKVMVLGHYSAISSSRTPWETDFVTVNTVRGGKVIRFQEFVDCAKLNAAFPRQA